MRQEAMRLREENAKLKQLLHHAEQERDQERSRFKEVAFVSAETDRGPVAAAHDVNDWWLDEDTAAKPAPNAKEDAQALMNEAIALRSALRSKDALVAQLQVSFL